MISCLLIYTYILNGRFPLIFVYAQTSISYIYIHIGIVLMKSILRPYLHQLEEEFRTSDFFSMYDTEE